MSDTTELSIMEEVQQQSVYWRNPQLGVDRQHPLVRITRGNEQPRVLDMLTLRGGRIPSYILMSVDGHRESLYHRSATTQ